MGEYAEMEIFAQIRGKTTSDLTIDEFAEFYSEYDDSPKPKPNPFKCRCGKNFKSMKAITAHKRDKHPNWET